MTRQHGLTLVELLATATIIAIIVTTALPSMAKWQNNQRVESAAHHLLQALMLARNEAVGGRARASLMAEPNGWETGWRLFRDLNSDGQLDENEPIIARQGALPDVSIRGNQPVKSLISFRTDGRSVLPNNAFQAGTLHICPTTNAEHAYKVVISRGGRARVERIPAETCAEEE